MRIIVRTVGERTTAECIRRAALVGDVDVIEGLTPFCEVLKATYELGMSYDQPWVPVIDADVLLTEGTVERALRQLKLMPDVFCLDGKTKDKILCTNRRAGVHIYNRAMLGTALQYVADSIKPETRVRQAMAQRHDAPTHTGSILFGRHDYGQYYRDLWRKAYLQTQKLRKKLPRHTGRWTRLAITDPDFRVIMAAHKAGKRDARQLRFDASINYGAVKGIAALGLKEKGPYEAT